MDVPCTPKTKFKASDTECSPFLVPSTPLMTKIGFGTGVSVYHLYRSPRFGNERSPWAIKKINNKPQRNINDRLLKEAKILSSVNHPNIVGYRGFTTTSDGKEVILMEECTQSLGDFIENFNRDYGAFSPVTILQVISSVCKALHYLHTEKKLIHGDIKSFNILIKGEFESIKLCDFGVSLEIGEDGTSNEMYIGTLAWSAPEILADGPITAKADIFAFGLTIYEMLTLKLPHIGNCDSNEMDSTAGLDVSNESLEDTYGTRIELPVLGSEYSEIVSLYKWCTEADYTDRPTAKDILDFLQSSIENNVMVQV